MKIALTAAPDTLNERVLNAAVEAATEVAQSEYEAGKVPPLQKAIDDGVRWAPEANPPGQESFDPPSVFIPRGTADCDDLAPTWAAELRYSGVDPDAKAEVYQSGPKRYHVIVRRGDGTVDDPSKWAGMGKKVDGARVPLRKQLGSSPLVVGFAPSRRGVRARLDVQGDVCGGVGIERIGADALDALDRAVRSVGILALWGAPSEVLARLAACAGAIREPSASGMSWEDYIGAVTATIDPNQVSNIALSILDPLGIHNMIAPAASAFLDSYARGPQGAGKKKVTVQAQTVGRGSKSSRGSSSRGGSRGGSSGRGHQDSRSSQSQDDGGDYGDPYGDQPGSSATYDPSTGKWYDGSTGLVLDPSTGRPVVYAQQSMAYPTAPAPYQGNPYGGGGAMPGDPYQLNAYTPYQSGPYSPQGYGVPYGYTPQQYSTYYPNGY